MKINGIFKIIANTLLLYISVLSSSCVSVKYLYYYDLAYGSEQRQKLDLYIPRKKTGEVGLILSIHGGGWTSGDKEVYRDANAYYSGELDYVAAAINYRFASASVDAFDIMDDITSALSFIKARALRKNININKVLLTGLSAGGHLALLYAYSRVEEAPIKPTAVMSLSGPVDLTNKDYVSLPIWQYAIYPLFSNVSGYAFDASTYETAIPYLEAVSPLNYVDSHTVPTIIAHAPNDPIVPFSEAQRLNDKLTEEGVEHDFFVFLNSGHTLQNDPLIYQESQEALLDYAQRYI